MGILKPLHLVPQGIHLLRAVFLDLLERRLLVDKLAALEHLHLQGLGGEVRNVLNPDLRLREIRRLGFKKVILPKKRLEQIDTANYDLEIYGVSNVRQAINLI